MAGVIYGVDITPAIWIEKSVQKNPKIDGNLNQRLSLMLLEELSVRAYFIRETGRVIVRYYPHFRFALADLCLSLLYLFCNPYRYCRKFLQKRGKQEIYGYGETPLTTLQIIANESGVNATDCWLELGSGRGRAALWIAHFIGCQTLGIEWIDRFARRANWIARLFQFKNLLYTCQNVLDAPFSQASVVYLYGTSWSDELIEQLQERMKTLPQGSKIVSISFPLPAFHLIRSFPVSFPWGETQAYLSESN